MGGAFHTPVYAQGEGMAKDSITVDRVVELVNESRLGHGKNMISLDEDLSYAATLKVEDMFDRQYFAHDTPTGESPWYWVLEAGYDYKYSGENLAIHFESASSQHRAWMESPLHRKNILNENYRDIGVAIKTDIFQDKETTIVVQLFGTRMKEEELAVSHVREEYNTYKEEQGIPQETVKEDRGEEDENQGIVLFTRGDSDWKSFREMLIVTLVLIMMLSISIPLILVIAFSLWQWYGESSQMAEDGWSGMQK